jgi:hypothetical protein
MCRREGAASAIDPQHGRIVKNFVCCREAVRAARHEVNQFLVDVKAA